MKRTIIALTVMTAFSAAAAGTPNPSPSAYDRLQDIAIAANDRFNDAQQVNISKNENDIVNLTNDTARQFDQVNQYVKSVDQARADGDAQLGQQIQQVQQAQGNFVTKPDYAADQQIQGVRDSKQDILINSADSKATAALQGVAANGAALTGKVDKTDFVADQQRQDDALNNEASIRADGDSALDAKIGTKADQAALDKETADRVAANHAQDVVTAQNYHDTTQKLATKVDTSTFTADQKRQDSLIATKVDNSTFQQRAADLDVRIAENRAAQQKTNQVVAGHTAQLANHEQRITGLEQQTNANFKDLRNQIDDNKREANAGIAGVAAIATIPQVTNKQDFSIGAGVGARDGESALAVGFSGRITPNVVTKVAVSTDSQSGWTVGAGMSYGW